jgi:hypothetical protein
MEKADHEAMIPGGYGEMNSKARPGVLGAAARTSLFP